MLDALRRPLPSRLLIAGVAGAALLVALYCTGYTALAGHPESFSSAFGWALANICPWLLAIERGKRARSLLEVAFNLATGLLASVVLGYLTAASADGFAFELWRRLPAVAAAAALVALLRSRVGRQQSSNDIPLLPRQIEWVRAAGNYVELRASGRTIVHRASLSAVELQLRSQGFVRIHRSMLVRRDCIARIRPEDVVLADGTHLRVGKRYRAALAA